MEIRGEVLATGRAGGGPGASAKMTDGIIARVDVTEDLDSEGRTNRAPCRGVSVQPRDRRGKR